MKKFIIASALLAFALPSAALALTTDEWDEQIINGAALDVSGRVLDQSIFPVVADHQSDHDTGSGRIILHFHAEPFNQNVRMLRRTCHSSRIAQLKFFMGCTTIFKPFTIRTINGDLLIIEKQYGVK